MKVRPISDRVLVRRVEEETMSSGGIIIPDSAREKPAAGEVVAVGDGKTENGNKIAMSVKVNDKVMFGKYAGQEVKVNNEELLIMREEDIIAIID